MFYRNMLRSYSASDLTGTLVFLSSSLLLSLLPLLQTVTPSVTRCDRETVTHTLTEISDIVKRTLEVSQITVSVKSTAHLKSVISAVTWPKLAKFVTFPQNCHIVSVILEGYLSCISSSNYPVIKTVTSNQGCILSSRFYHGILLPYARNRDFANFVRSTKRTETVSMSGETCRSYSVVIFSCNIPRELESLEGETFTFLDTDKGLEEVLVTETLKILSESLRTQRVDIVCCQKVVHEKVRSFLRSKGVLVLERLSLLYAEDLATLSGCVLSPSVSQWDVGRVKDVKLEKIEKKSFLHFIPENGSHFGVLSLFAQVC